MKRVFILKGLDCPNCSAKIEKEVGALPGVESSVVNLMQQTLTVQSEKSADATLAEQVETIVHSHEPDVEVSEKTEPAVTKVYLLKGLDCPNCSAKIEKEVGELGGVASSTVNLMNQTLTVQAGTSVATSLLDTVTTIVHSHEPDVEVSEKTEPAVTKVYLLKGLDCPNCSAKIEKEVGELGGVASSTVNLMNQTLTVQAGTSVATSLLDTVTTIVHSHEPDVEVSEKTEPAVTKVYLLKGLDCPNCSAKIEKEVGELDGVTSSTVNLMNQTLTVQAGTSVAASLLDTVTTIVHSHEPDVEVSEKQLEATAPVKKDEKAAVYNDEDKKRTIRLAVGAVVYAIGMALTVFAKLPTLAELAFLIVAYVILGWDVVWQAVKNITRGQVFDEHFLMSVSTIGAFAIGEYPEAVAVMLFYQVGEFFQSLAVKRSRKSISDLMDICPDSATVKRNGVLQVVSPESVAVGEIIVVKPGEKIPLDGIVVDGESMLDTKALTGESVPRSIRKGDEALSGCINQSGLLTLKVTKSFGESTVSKITDLVENASARKAPTENFITTFARYYTPVVVGMAAVLAIIPPLVLGGGWSEWLRRGFVFLIVSCPCATVMLTGDDERIGKSVADELGLDAYYAQLLPDQKVEKLEMLDKQKRQGSKLAFVGDGINDAPVLARADVGIAMGGLGSDAAIEAADVVLMTDEPSKLVEAIDVAKATKRIVMQNIVIALGIKSVFLVLGALGMAGMWEAVFGDVGVTIIAVLNAMRILKK